MLHLVLTLLLGQAETPADDLTRQALIVQAEKSHEAGKHDAALAGALRALELRPSATLLLFIAQEQEELRQSVPAFASAERCARAAELELQARFGSPDDPRKQLREEARARCKEIAKRLEPFVSHLVIRMQAPPPGLVVRIDGRPVNAASVGLPYLTSAGTIVVEAAAPDRIPSKKEVAVKEGETVTIDVDLQPKPQAVPITCPRGYALGANARCVVSQCPAGKLSVAEGAGCCWPNQLWDEARGACGGNPLCPQGLMQSGTDCATPAMPMKALQASDPPLGPPQPPPPMDDMGIGLRVGLGSVGMNLACKWESGECPEWDTKFRDSLTTVGLVRHSGGDGHFWKFELLYSKAGSLSWVGPGIYPVNFGYFFTRTKLFLYGTFGGAASFIWSEKQLGVQVKGALLNIRGAIGLKFRPIDGLTMGIEWGLWQPTFTVVDINIEHDGISNSKRELTGPGNLSDINLTLEWL